MKKLILVLLLAISIFMASPPPAFASVPRWSYQRGNINALNSCRLSDAEGLAQDALKSLGFRNVQSSGPGNIIGNTDNVMALVFITDKTPGKRGVVLVTTGNGADEYRRQTWSKLGSKILFDCGINGNPV